MALEGTVHKLSNITDVFMLLKHMCPAHSYCKRL